jgi:hypothetical protein
MVKHYCVHPNDPYKKYAPILKTLKAAREYQAMYGGTIREFEDDD